MSRRKNSERGQVIILLTAGLITLLGFTALAIDGGRIYAEKRAVQGIADTSSFTGALYIAQDDDGVSTADLETARQVAINRAVENGLDISEVEVDVDVDGSYYLVEVILENTIDPVFAQLVYEGDLRVKAKAVARVLKVTELAFGNAIYAMSDCDKSAIRFTGSGSVDISGTGIYSNSTCDDSIVFDGNSTTVISGSVRAAGEVNIKSDDVDLSEGYAEDQPQLGFISLDPASCDIPKGARTIEGGEVYFTPGLYPYGIKESKKSIYHFKPGFYCIYGGFAIDNGTFLGEDVSFFVGSGNVTLGGDTTLVAPEKGIAIDPRPYDWHGMLFYVAKGKVSITGNDNSYYEGSVYAPSPDYNPTCKLAGTSGTDGYNMQLVCDSIEVRGDGTLVLNYDRTNSHIPPTIVDLVE